MAEDPVVLTDVTVRVPRRTAPVLNGIDLRVPQGEHVLLLGPSGSGKSTLLHCITGVVPHTVSAQLSGTVTTCGTPTTATTVVELSRHVGVVAQDPAAAVCLPTVEQELALPLENHAAEPATIGERIDSALRVVGASHLRERATGKLSGGESQRVALAATLVSEPAVLLLDEPTSMLDAAGVADVRRALAAATSQGDTTVVIVEHRLDDLAGDGGAGVLPARAVVVDEGGRLVADGPTAQVLDEHAAMLLRAGCWLPLAAELRALGGVPGGIAAPVNRALLRRLAHEPPGGATPVRPVPQPRRPVLRATGLAVSRHTARPHRRARRSGDGEAATLSGIDLALHTGEVVALLGRNGVGKTSLLLTLAGLLAPAAGSVEGPRAGMVFQNAEHQFVAHTVAEEVGHGLPDLAGDVVRRQLRRHRLEHLADQSPFRLSGGEKRRLSLAAMLAHDRPCLFADEPTLGLDRRDTVATTAALREAAAEGRAVVVVSHDLRTVLSVADRVVVLGEGTVVADGPTVQVLRDPAVRRRGGIVLPPLAAWLLDELAEGAAIRRALAGLDAAVGADCPAPVTMAP